jgi:hypothetical protein
MSAFTIQVLRDTTEKAVIKLTGNIDSGVNEDNNVRIAANTLAGALDANNMLLYTDQSVSNTAKPYYDLQVTRIMYNVSIGTAGNGFVQLAWIGSTANGIIANLSGTGEYGEQQNFPSIPNNAVASNGNIGIRTFGAQNPSSYTIWLELRKNNLHYQRGQFNDPAAFNFGDYALHP